MNAATRQKVAQLQRLERIRAGEERQAQAAFQQALGAQRQAEARVDLCRTAYQEILEAGNEQLRGEVNVRRLPLLQLMVGDARRALEGSERQLQAATYQAELRRQHWLAARQQREMVGKVEAKAAVVLRQAVERDEQQQLDEMATIRAARRKVS